MVEQHHLQIVGLNSIDPHIKFTMEQPNMERAIPFLDTLPNPMDGEEISVSVYRKPTHTYRSQKSCGKSPYGQS